MGGVGQWLYFRVLAICRYFWGVIFNTIFFGSIESIFSIFLWGIVRIKVRSVYWTDSYFHLVITAQFLL